MTISLSVSFVTAFASTEHGIPHSLVDLLRVEHIAFSSHLHTRFGTSRTHYLLFSFTCQHHATIAKTDSPLQSIPEVTAQNSSRTQRQYANKSLTTSDSHNSTIDQPTTYISVPKQLGRDALYSPANKTHPTQCSFVRIVYACHKPVTTHSSSLSQVYSKA